MVRNISDYAMQPIQWERKAVSNMIISCLCEILSEKKGAQELSMKLPNEETNLLGSRAVIDSLELIELIVSVEKKLREDHAIAVTISDEQAIALRQCSFRTVGTLAEYIHSLCLHSGGRQIEHV